MNDINNITDTDRIAWLESQADVAAVDVGHGEYQWSWSRDCDYRRIKVSFREAIDQKIKEDYNVGMCAILGTEPIGHA